MADIDFVIPWVDGSDPEWRARKAAFMGRESTDDRDIRYRDWGLLRYWFRGVEKFTPWVRHVWFICDQEPPNWLNAAHSKLRIVHHDDYLPTEYRPAFSSHPIELNLHRIQGLSEHFVYFNDDMFIIKQLGEDYFFKYGLPRDCALLNTIPTDDLVKNGPEAIVFPHFLNVASYINRDYDYRKCQKRNLWKWFHPYYGKNLIRNLMLSMWPRFVGGMEPHLPQSFLKSSFEQAWGQDFDILDETSRHHIRNDRDVNQWLIRWRQIMDGRFVVRKYNKNSVFFLNQDTDLLHRTIKEQLTPMICLNDVNMDSQQFSNMKDKLTEDFNIILKETSSFEKGIE